MSDYCGFRYERDCIDRENTKRVQDLGPDAALVVTPYWQTLSGRAVPALRR